MTHTRSILRGAAALGATALLAGSIAAFRPLQQKAAGVSFRINASMRIYAGDTPRGQDDLIMRGRGVAAENHSRIEFLAFTPAPQGITTDDFLIALDSSKVFVEKTNPSGPARYIPQTESFGGPGIAALARQAGGGGRGGFGGGPGGAGGGGDAGGRGARGGGGGPPGGGGGGAGARGARGGGAGGAGGAGGFPGGGRGGRGRGGFGGSGVIDQLELLDVNFALEKLADETLDNKPAKHYRVTTDYRVIWTDQSVPAHQVTEIWTTQLPTDIPNPFEPFFVPDQSTDGVFIEYALKLRAIRSQVEGTPIKMISTTTFSNLSEVAALQSYVRANPEDPNPKLTVVQQTQISGIAPSEVDPKVFAVTTP